MENDYTADKNNDDWEESNMKLKEIYDYIDKIAPFDTAEAFDNCGLLAGDPEREICKIGLALDITHAVIDKAVEYGIDLIITHHPILFTPIKRLCAPSVFFRLIESRIATIAAHTNLDKAMVNDVLAEYYHLTQLSSPEILEDLGRKGILESSMPVEEYAKLIKKELKAGAVRYYDAGKPVENVVYISGSGGGMFREAISCGADTLVTGDLKHDIFVEAQNIGLNLIEANHFDSENTVMEPLKRRLEQFFKGEVWLLCPENPVKTV